MAGRRRARDGASTAPRRGRVSSGHASSAEPVGLSVVGIGASAGGLEAFQKFFDAMPPDSGIAFILVQHLDPTHQSMMVDLLAPHTSMKIEHAADGMRPARNCIYVIPPGVYLSVRDGALQLSKPPGRHVRLPFDFLLDSLADEFGERAVCVILSGTGADGSLGLKAVKETGGLVIAQDPGEAGHDGMPRNAIRTGSVDLVLPVAKIPQALVKYHRRMALMGMRSAAVPQGDARDWLPAVIDLLSAETGHDFTLYKQGTLRRRIERRMAMAAIESDDLDRYLDVLRSDPDELDLLAKDLLINVTSFFRDQAVFDLLAEKVVPDLVREHAAGSTLRIWVAGCSTGEEAYSLAMLFQEQIKASKHNVKLQIFASDVDADAVATAREGRYPETIEAEVAAERLARFFAKEEHAYRVRPELRAAVVFTVHDVLTDPPFARLDLISCRNLLIYLQPEAQATVISRFHFALRDGGVLFLGASETAGKVDGRFKVISKPARLYRHIGQGRLADLEFATGAGEGLRVSARAGQDRSRSNRAVFADLCQRMVTESYAPAAVLINREHECLYSLGPTDRYLRAVPGPPTHDLFAMARDDVRTKLRSAVQRAVQENARVEVSGGRTIQDGKPLSFSIVVHPVSREGENLHLVCFVDEPERERKPDGPLTPQDASRVAELEQELEAVRGELSEANGSLEEMIQRQREVNEEALSVNEEYQVANEELETSKEELQSLNEELTALNSQLHETLERERSTANDLQNVLYSTDVATLFLDPDLNIRFFTPATRALFNIIPSDVGRPLVDLRSLAADSALLEDAEAVLRTHTPIAREVGGRGGVWYSRRILPYRAEDNGVEGVVITFTDITERRNEAGALDAAKRTADLANVAKSRFLAVASHDLRQPLQTLFLLQGLLAKSAKDEKARKLLGRLGEALGAMSRMLNALLDLNQIEAGTIRAEPDEFPIGGLLDRLGEEFTYLAGSRGLAMHVVPCGRSIRSDPHLLEQMIRNLLSNAVKYTRSGRVLLGCRRREGKLRIEVWDTGMGIAEGEQREIFEEYHQIDNPARDPSRGLGLGLSIVQRFADLLDHRVSVHSVPGKGSVFAIEVTMAPGEPASRRESAPRSGTDAAESAARRAGVILVVDDDPLIRDILEVALSEEGHRVVTAPDGPRALALMAAETVQPDLILADYNLPGGMNGLQFAEKARNRLRRPVPVAVLTGDISAEALRDIAQQDCTHLTKPVKLEELTHAIRRFLPSPRFPSAARGPRENGADGGAASPAVYVIDDDSRVLDDIRRVLEDDGRTVETYSSAEAFLEADLPSREACLLIDAVLPGISGLQLLERLGREDRRLTTIMFTGKGDVAMAVQAMKAGASDFIEKPIGVDGLLASVDRALGRSRDAAKQAAWRVEAASRIGGLTQRQREIMDLVLSGHPNKNIAADLGISQRTVENHRAAVMMRTGTKSLPALARLAVAAASPEAD
ncbi:MAG: response regulator [Alphaproteobacteria bacterium]|nr:response regulator [Alphaproteobacteria bacterium]